MCRYRSIFFQISKQLCHLNYHRKYGAFNYRTWFPGLELKKPVSKKLTGFLLLLNSSAVIIPVNFTTIKILAGGLLKQCIKRYK